MYFFVYVALILSKDLLIQEIACLAATLMSFYLYDHATDWKKECFKLLLQKKLKTVLGFLNFASTLTG